MVESKRYTGGRTTRLKDRRRLKADTILARTGWLADSLVLWTGRRPGLGARDDHETFIVDSLPRAVEARLAHAHPGLYAVKVGFTDRAESPFAWEARALTRVDDALLGDTARALNAARRFPRAIGRQVGSLGGWLARAEERTRVARRCLEAAEEPTPASGLALEEDAVWLRSPARWRMWSRCR